MTVTAIEPRRKGLSALYIDGELAVKIDTETVIESRLHAGDELDDDALHELIEKSDIKRAKEKALWLISYRDHSKKELVDKIRRTTNEQAANSAVERMEQLGLVNDERFAQKYAAELLTTKRLSPSFAVRRLCEKGISREVAQEIVDELDPDISENIRAVTEKKYAKNLSDEKGYRRAVSGLMRLGYSYSDIKSVLSEYLDKEDFGEY